MTPPNMIPRLRVTTHQATPTRQEVQIAIGEKYRRLPVVDARAHADRVHDLCDRIEAAQREVD